jgi:hypothetical protein
VCKLLKADDIVRNLELLGQELEQRGVTGEILIAGGAFMLLVIKNRDTTNDIDAYFATEPQAIREAAQVVAEREGLAPDWLNDGVTGFFDQSPPTELWAEYPRPARLHCDAGIRLRAESDRRSPQRCARPGGAESPPAPDIPR